ncbi:MAG: hypothetical protein ACE5IP_05755 [Terriglobia bacterium]
MLDWNETKMEGFLMSGKANVEWLVALRLGGAERKLFKVKVTRKGNYFVFLRYSNPPKGFPPLDIHMSYFYTGERHLTVKERGKRHPGTAQTMVTRQPTSTLKGIEELLPGAPLFKGQFPTLELLHAREKNAKNDILLDGDAKGLRDDYLLIRVFLVEPHQEHLIPTPPNVGLRVSYIERSVTPWIAIEAFQEGSETHDGGNSLDRRG